MKTRVLLLLVWGWIVLTVGLAYKVVDRLFSVSCICQLACVLFFTWHTLSLVIIFPSSKLIFTFSEASPFPVG